MMKQMKFAQTIRAFLIVSACFFALPGCEKPEGPLEKAGKEVDQAVENFGQPKAGPVEKAGQAVDDAAERAGEQIEKTGEQVQDAAKGDKP
jgi:predicted small secreted protein